ncbi:hypothetical protein D770_00975 [Flammeovirgaceae bacterium 311]|nr:hypothetical protein D770_00975 [Flammeovirgaceae bacterium 311]
MLFAMLPLFIFSCGKDDDPAPQVLQPKLDGVYVYGTNTVADVPTAPAARLSGATLNPAKSSGAATMPGVYGKYMYIGANSTIQISEVENEVATVYGAENGGTRIAGEELDHTDVQDEFIQGTLEANAAPIEISEEGLYYLFVNTNDMHFRLMRVEPEMFGDTQPGQWTTGTALPMVSADRDGAVFEANGVSLRGESGYKYRLNKGYEVYNDGSMATLTFLGVESYGAAWDAGVNELIYKDENIPHQETGVFTVRLEYDAATGEWTETKIKDYSTTQVGLFGNAYTLPNGEAAAWNEAYGLTTPEKDGNVYTWSWNDVALIEGGEFVLLENGEWGGLAVLYNDATERAGNAFDEGVTKAEGSENFMVVAGGEYDISLAIDVETGTRTLTIANSN